MNQTAAPELSVRIATNGDLRPGSVGGGGHDGTMTRADWDGQAATFDDQPDHGLKDPAVRAAWSDLLLPLLPPAPAAVVDLGCGTGSLAVLLAQAGYAVHGVDLSPGMLAVAKDKAEAAGVEVAFLAGDAADPPCSPGSYDVVLVRHVLWAMPDPGAALDSWVRLLKPGGRLVLVEGRWFTGAGISAEDCRRLVLGRREEAIVSALEDPALWGAPIEDERYVLVSRR